MSEVIVKLNSDRIKIKGGEYVQDLVRCGECKNYTEAKGCFLEDNSTRQADDFCSYGEVRDE